MYSLADVIQTVARNLCEVYDLFVGLRDGQLGRTDVTGIDKLQLHLAVVHLGLGLDASRYGLYDQRREPDQDAGVEEVKERVEHRNTIERSGGLVR